MCLTVTGDTLRESRGHIGVTTGLTVSRSSLSTSSIKLGMLSGHPNTDVELFVDLPRGWNRKSAAPEPDHVASFAWTRLIWEGDDRYGQSVPVPGGNRGIAENLGIDLELESPRLKRIETTLLFFLSALFGAGFALLAECTFAAITKSRKTTEDSA